MPNRIFSLERNDETVSSFYTLNDLVLMINNRLNFENQISEAYIRQNFYDLIQLIENIEVIDERNGFKIIWGPTGERRIPTDWKLRPLVANHYELVLYNIFIRVVGTGNVKVQYQIKGEGHHFDFMIEYEGEKYLIEFEGIDHFKANRRGVTIHPLEQLNSFNNPDFKLIIWPYWIQRCEMNLKVVLGLEINGLGAIWGADYFYNDFPWQDSNNIIKTLNAQFNIERNGNIGYIYGPDENRNYPEHPFIKGKILNNIAPSWTIEKFIPKGTLNSIEDRNYWLPDRLKIK